MSLIPHELLDLIATGRDEDPKLRDRDLAETLGLAEAHLVAADMGTDRARVTRIDATPAALIPAVQAMGDVMALTRNDSAVHERRGTYIDWREGDHAGLVVGPEIDLRIFPRQWVHGFAVERDGPDGTRRSLQVFDAHGDAIHKVHLIEDSDVAAFDAAVTRLATPADAPFAMTARPEVEPARADPAHADVLREEWVRMTDTHQFLKLARKLKMNRLGAYRVAGAPLATRLGNAAVSEVLERAAAESVPLMIFVGNMGCIQIHGGTIGKVKPVGPWQNALDPRFNLHLRADHIAEVWLVEKPTRHGAAISVEAFDARGALILQIFGHRLTDEGFARWNGLMQSLASTDAVTA